jgi:hypothetical protein
MSAARLRTRRAMAVIAVDFLGAFAPEHLGQIGAVQLQTRQAVEVRHHMRFVGQCPRVTGMAQHRIQGHFTR